MAVKSIIKVWDNGNIIKENVKFLISPIKNIDILKMVNKKCILISHHGSAILEGLYCGFKCISSTATFWNKKLQLTNSWNNLSSPSFSRTSTQ